MKKRHFAQRLDVELIQRIETVAQGMRATPRTVLELCLFSGLPELEQQFKIKQPKPRGRKDFGGGAQEPCDDLQTNRLFSRQLVAA